MNRPLAIAAGAFLAGALAGVAVLGLGGWEWPPAFGAANEDHAGHDMGEGADEREVLYWRAPMDPNFTSDRPGKSPMGMDLVPVYAQETEREVLYWRAPMDPNYISDQPGKSPMGMDLVPVYADEAGDAPEGAVRLDADFVQRIGVRTAPVEVRDLARTIRTVGTLAHNDRQIAWINTKFEGWIENVSVNYLGETVEEGQVLFDIYSPELVTTQNEYLRAVQYAKRLDPAGFRDIAARARSLVESTRARLRHWDVTDEQIAVLEQEGTPRRTLSVVSPVTGVVVGKMDEALEGMYVGPGMNLYKVADLTTIWVDVEIFEHQVEAMRIGQRARVELPYVPGRPYSGVVRFLYPHFDQETRTMTVSIELQNPDLTLRAGMYANVTFDVPVARDALTVPESAVIRSGARSLAVVELGPGLFRVAEVTLGAGADGVREIVSGLAEGDRVAVSAQFLIDSESNLSQAVRAAPEPPEASEASDEPEPPPADSAMERHRHH